MKIIKIVILILIIFCSCGWNKGVEYKSVVKAYTDFLLSEENVDLLKADSLLHNNREFKKNGLTVENNVVAIPILMELHKYEELETLLLKDASLIEYYKYFSLNVVRSYLDSTQYTEYLNNNLDMVNDSIANGADSTIYFDYFLTKMHLKGKELALLEIDSMNAVDLQTSNFFYEDMLKDAILDFPEDRILLNYHKN